MKVALEPRFSSATAREPSLSGLTQTWPLLGGGQQRALHAGWVLVDGDHFGVLDRLQARRADLREIVADHQRRGEHRPHAELGAELGGATSPGQGRGSRGRSSGRGRPPAARRRRRPCCAARLRTGTLPGSPTSVSVRQLLPDARAEGVGGEGGFVRTAGWPSPYCSGCRKSQIDSSIGRLAGVGEDRRVELRVGARGFRWHSRRHRSRP